MPIELCRIIAIPVMMPNGIQSVGSTIELPLADAIQLARWGMVVIVPPPLNPGD